MAQPTNIEKMKKIAALDDPEEAHSEADDLLLKLVRKHVPNGNAIAAEYNKIEKWYG